MNGPSEETALLARALLAAGGRLPLLPEGEARLDKAGERRLEEGGRALTVTEYLISGLDFAPPPPWLDADGKFFPAGRSRLMVIRKGWESGGPALIAAQRENEVRRAAAQAHRLAHRPAGDLVIHDAALFDAETATVRPGQTIVVSGERIK